MRLRELAGAPVQPAEIEVRALSEARIFPARRRGVYERRSRLAAGADR